MAILKNRGLIGKKTTTNGNGNGNGNGNENGNGNDFDPSVIVGEDKTQEELMGERMADARGSGRAMGATCPSSNPTVVAECNQECFNATGSVMNGNVCEGWTSGMGTFGGGGTVAKVNRFFGGVRAVK